MNFLTIQYAKDFFGIGDDLDTVMASLVRAANTAVYNAIHAKNPGFIINEESQFFIDARDVALIHLESNLRRQVNQLYKEAADIYKNYQLKIKELTDAVWAENSPREILATNWENEMYRPHGQDFGVPIDY